uniref:Ig-like domain-containing protein n=1 Tax=Denticeps clupeoides TaxID=299321 RepID=A0AAY4BTU5_9TELE
KYWTPILKSSLSTCTGVKVHCNVELTQIPSVVQPPGQPLTLTCKVSGYSVTDSSYCTHWIRQPQAGKSLEWVGSICSGDGTAYNSKLNNRFSISQVKSSNTLTLHGNRLQTEDAAVYYCAREPQ